MGRLKNKRSISSPEEGDASREERKGFTIVSKKIPYFVNLKSALIELKKSASRWTRTRRKISPIEWRKMSTFDTKRIGGSLSIHLAKINRWNSVQTTTKRWLNYTVFTKSLDSFLAIPAMASVVFFIQHILVAVERFLVELMTINQKVRNWAHVKSSMIERGDPLCRFFTQPQTCRLSRFFVAVRSFTGDSSLLQPTVCVKTTPHTT